jgi:hypothetical protein
VPTIGARKAAMSRKGNAVMKARRREAKGVSMMTDTIDIGLTYNVWVPTRVKLPDGRKWEDVEDFGVVWNELYLTFKDGTKCEIELPEIEPENYHDWKRPNATTVYACPPELADTDKELCEGDVLRAKS